MSTPQPPSRSGPAPEDDSEVTRVLRSTRGTAPKPPEPAGSEEPDQATRVLRTTRRPETPASTPPPPANAPEPTDEEGIATRVAGNPAAPTRPNGGFAAGQVLLRRFELKRQLGRGGMGVVWLARDLELDRDVALKFLPQIVVSDPAAVADLKRETRRALELTHPHIVRVHDFHEEDDIAGISMEYVDGETLTGLRLKQPGEVFEPEQLLEWLGQLADALEYAHTRAKVIHRDLKPANLMVNARGELKVTDFGIAAAVSDTVTRVSRLVDTSGTPAYGSPQQLLGGVPTPADDVYAVGATLYELLTSRPPFYTGSLLLQVQQVRPPPLADRRRELGVTAGPIPPAWEQTIAACLEKDPKLRPTGAAELVRRLRAEAAPVRGGAVVPPVLPETKTGGAAAAVAPEKELAAAVTTAGTLPPPPPRPVRSLRWLAWLAGLSALTAAGAGVWLGDVPNRIMASLDNRRGHRALVESDWAGALNALKDAVLLRPTDALLRGDYNTAQRRWLDFVGRELEGLSPEQAQAWLQRPEIAQTGELLTEPYLREYRDRLGATASGVAGSLRRALDDAVVQATQGRFVEARSALESLKERAGGMPEYAQSLARVEEVEVRRGIDDATGLADQGNFVGALAALEEMAKRGSHASEVEAARGRVRRQAAVAGVERLSRGVRSGRADDVQSVLLGGGGGGTSDGTSVAAARALIEARTLDAFLEALRASGFGSAADPAQARRLHHALVDSLRDRFTDQPAVARYLGEGYAAWARVLLGQDRPGFALYALERALAEGVAPDPSLEKEARTAMVETLDLALLVPPSEQAARDNPIPAASVRTAMREQLERVVGSWIELLELRPVGRGRAPLELRTSFGAISSRDERTEEARAARFQSGSRMVGNPEYTRLANELADAQRRAAETNRRYNELRNQGSNDAERILAALFAAGLKGEVDKTNNLVVELQRKLASTPSSLREPVFENEPYTSITHRLTYEASLTTTVQRGSDDLAPWLVWKAVHEHTTTEVLGNSSRGVPVQRASYPTLPQVADTLGGKLAAEVRADAVSLIDRVESATFTIVDADLEAEDATAAVVADRRWGLARLWRLSGVGVSQSAEMERAVRAQLGLSEVRIETVKESPQQLAKEPVRDPALTTVKPTPTTSGGSNGSARSSATPTLPAKPSPTQEATPATQQVYTVRPGDTAEGVASRFGVTVLDLQKANPGVGLRRIRPGQKIVIPRK